MSKGEYMAMMTTITLCVATKAEVAQMSVDILAKPNFVRCPETFWRKES